VAEEENHLSALVKTSERLAEETEEGVRDNICNICMYGGQLSVNSCLCHYCETLYTLSVG